MAFTINPNPKSVGVYIDDANRFEGDYNGRLTITKVDRFRSEGTMKGAVIVHMTCPSLKKNNQEIRDMFPRKKPETPIDDWAQTQINRASGALRSAGLNIPEAISFKSDDDVKAQIEVLNKVAEMLQPLVGKEIVASQYTKDGNLRLNYKFIENKAEDEIVIA